MTTHKPGADSDQTDETVDRLLAPYRANKKEREQNEEQRKKTAEETRRRLQHEATLWQEQCQILAKVQAKMQRVSTTLERFVFSLCTYYMRGESLELQAARLGALWPNRTRLAGYRSAGCTIAHELAATRCWEFIAAVHEDRPPPQVPNGFKSIKQLARRANNYKGDAVAATRKLSGTFSASGQALVEVLSDPSSFIGVEDARELQELCEKVYNLLDPFTVESSH